MGFIADFTVLNFQNYQDYLRSFISIEDMRYIQNQRATHQLVKLGYRSTNRIYEEEEFYKMKTKTEEMLNPTIKSVVVCSKYLKGDDPGLVELAKREQLNILQELSTIIFIVARQPNGFDISGYIDYAASLRNYNLGLRGATNWKRVFDGTDKVRPKPSDLSFYDWQKKTFAYNDSENYHTCQTGQSLSFKHKGDHKIITPDSKHLENVIRKMIYFSSLGSLVLYDHVVRKKL